MPWSVFLLVCPLWGCISLPAGSINTRPLSRWRRGSKRPSESLNAPIRVRTVPCCITGDATLRRRFQALVLAPLLGIERLSSFDTQEPPLETLIGGSDQYTTLTSEENT